MKMLRCQCCNATLAWDGRSEVVTCESCGMRYQMTPRDPRRAVLENALVGGCVAPRPYLNDKDRGKVCFVSWLPQGWEYGFDQVDPNRYGSIATPFVSTIVMYTPDSSHAIAYTTSNAYVDAPQMGTSTMGGLFGGIASAFGGVAGDGMAGASGGQSPLDPRTNMRMRPLASAAQICDEAAMLRVTPFGLQLRQVIQETDQPDDIAKARFREMASELPPDVRRSMWSEWHRKLYSALLPDGTECIVMAEVEVTTNGFNVCEPHRANQQAGGFWPNMLGQFAQAMGQPMQPRIWQTDYELVMFCPTSDFQATFVECNRVRESIQRGPDFVQYEETIRTFMQQMAMQTQASINNATTQMMRDRAAHANRMSAILQDMNDHTTSVMHDITASSAATNERVANMHSEMIGGYNVYQGTDGNLVRADIGFDHVYQGNVDGQDWLVGVEGDWLEPGVDFIPLDQIPGGNY